MCIFLVLIYESYILTVIVLLVTSYTSPFYWTTFRFTEKGPYRCFENDHGSWNDEVPVLPCLYVCLSSSIYIYIIRIYTLINVYMLSKFSFYFSIKLYLIVLFLIECKNNDILHLNPILVDFICRIMGWEK